jgi:hypothetical protein
MRRNRLRATLQTIGCLCAAVSGRIFALVSLYGERQASPSSCVDCFAALPLTEICASIMRMRTILPGRAFSCSE